MSAAENHWELFQEKCRSSPSDGELWPLFSTSVIMAKGWTIEPWMGFHYPYSWVVFHRECDPTTKDGNLSAEPLRTAGASASTPPLLDVSRDTDLRHIMQNTKESIGCLSVADMDHDWQNPLYQWNFHMYFYSGKSRFYLFIFNQMEHRNVLVIFSQHATSC